MATTVRAMATLVPMWSALESAFESVESPPFTKKEPMIEAIIPTRAMAIGNMRSEIVTSSVAFSAARPPAKATSVIGARIAPAYDSKRSAPMPATSPTLSPTLSAMVGTDVSGLRVDAATNPAEQGDRAGTEAIGSHDFERLVDLEDEHEHDVDEHQPGKGQARHTEAHDCSPSKGHRERLAGTVLRCLGGPGVGHRGHGHARIAGGSR